MKTTTIALKVLTIPSESKGIKQNAGLRRKYKIKCKKYQVLFLDAELSVEKQGEQSGKVI